MRESLSRNTRTKTKIKARVTTVAAKSKSISRSGDKTVSSSRSKAKNFIEAKPVKASKPIKKSAPKKKSVAKVLKTASKKSKKASTRAKPRIKRVMVSPKVRAKTKSRPAAKAKVSAAKAKVKARARLIPKAKKTTGLQRSTKIRASKVRASKVRAKGRNKISIQLLVTPLALPPEPSRRQVSSAVLRVFEQAVKVFNRRQYDDAKPMFENLQTRFPNEVEIISRAQTYIQVCNQKLAHAQSTPRNADELYDHGVFALNIGDFPQARSFFEKALRLRPDEPYLLYSLAATHAQTGSLDQAIDYLKRSIQIQPRFRSQALNDTDFSGLRENKQFLELLGLTSPFERLELRR